FNSKYYMSVPLAQHSHSRLAVQTMASMIIGRINEGENSLDGGTSFVNLTSFDGQTNSSAKSATFFNDDHMRIIKFNRYKLTSATDDRFLPGHFIELQAKVKGQVVVRKYNPLGARGPFSTAIYPPGSPSLIGPKLSPSLRGIAKTPLLNPNNPNGCWSELYMIA
ncbi:3948_t:CDS:2, partial [Racocetra fulgida]